MPDINLTHTQCII